MPGFLKVKMLSDLKGYISFVKALNFNVDLCRSLPLERVGEGEARGIKTDR